jgi:excisionase family DNA binding protein
MVHIGVRTTAEPAMHTPYAFTVNDAAAYSGIGRTRLYELIGAGKLEALKAGKRTLIVSDSLRRYLETLPRADVRTGRPTRPQNTAA